MDMSQRSDTGAHAMVGAPNEATAQPLLLRLEGVRKEGDGWRAKCPSCNGSRRDVLTVAIGDKRILVHCFAGCAQDDVLAAVGLSWKNLQPTRTWPPSKAEDREWRMKQRQVSIGVAAATMQREIVVVANAASEVAHGRVLDGIDLLRLAQAIAAIDAVAAIYCDPYKHKAGG